MQYWNLRASLVLSGKESTCDAGDMGSIAGSGRSPGEGNGYPLPGILAWRIPWTEEPGGLQSMGVTRVRHDLATKQQQEFDAMAPATSLTTRLCTP